MEQEMHPKLYSYAVIILWTTIGISLSTVAHADKAKKKSTMSTKNQSKKTKWEQEPTTFLDIRLGQPLNISVTSECPVSLKSPPFLDSDALNAMPDGTHCYKLFQEDLLGITIEPIRVSPLRGLRVHTDNGSLTGKVSQISVMFDTADFDKVADILKARYGAPHDQSTDKVKTNGGAEFDNRILNWNGENVVIHVESLVNREVAYGHILENGKIFITTKIFSEQTNANENKATQEAAGRL